MAEPAVLDARIRVRLGPLRLEVALETRARAVAVVGPSGAGKSTLLRVLAGLEHRARGRVTVRGETWMDTDRGVFRPPWSRAVGWVPQDTLLFPHLTVRENLAYPAGADGSPGGGGTAAEAGAGEPLGLLEAARLVEAGHLLDRRPAVLSGGERQRVSLARALRVRPRLLLLDEPFSALDPALRDQLAGRLGEYLQRVRLPVVLVSHDEDDAHALGCQEFHLVDGHLA